jgi:uncharacterized protein (TIGR00255 family)
MTGYGEAAAEIGGVHYFVEVRSLNARYFKATVRLPDEFQGLEAELDSTLRGLLRRGTVTLTGKCTDTSESAAWEINHRALERYLEQIHQAPSATHQGVSVDAASLLALPGVLQPPPDEENRVQRARDAFVALTDNACAGLMTMREREGRALGEELLGQRALIAERLGRIGARAPQIVVDYERRLRERIESMLAQVDLQADRADVIKEIAVFAEKTDINEEITRLRGHLDQFEELVNTEGDASIGRTLDFLAQEMLREANTMASKSSDAEISRHIVEIKGAIDRIKEQVQNVE